MDTVDEANLKKMALIAAIFIFLIVIKESYRRKNHPLTIQFIAL